MILTKYFVSLVVPYNTINMYHSLYNTYNNVVLLSDDDVQ